MRILLLSIMLWSTASAAWCGTLKLVPERVHNGEIAMVRWQGDTPSFGVLRFNDQLVYLYPDELGAIALLPVGLEMPAGAYRVLCAVVDRWGKTTASELTLQVMYKERPLESLTLPEEMVTPKKPETLARIERESRQLNQVFAGRSNRLWERFERPVNEPINSVFGKRRLLNGKPKSPHSGTDFRSPAGTPVKAISSGRIVLCDELYYTGLTVIVDHGEGLFSLYAHLSTADCTEGQTVRTGQVLGKVGSSGRSTGPHLHLTVKLLGERVDPMALLALFDNEES